MISATFLIALFCFIAATAERVGGWVGGGERERDDWLTVNHDGITRWVREREGERERES